MKRFHISLFSALVLVIVMVLLFRTVTGRRNPLFDQGSQITFYANTKVGEEWKPEAADYFKEEDTDLSKISFDTEKCDWNQAGVYLIPVLYQGKVTNTAISLTVKAKEEGQPETKAGLNQNAVISH